MHKGNAFLFRLEKCAHLEQGKGPFVCFSDWQVRFCEQKNFLPLARKDRDMRHHIGGSGRIAEGVVGYLTILHQCFSQLIKEESLDGASS